MKAHKNAFTVAIYHIFDALSSACRLAASVHGARVHHVSKHRMSDENRPSCIVLGAIFYAIVTLLLLLRQLQLPADPDHGPIRLSFRVFHFFSIARPQISRVPFAELVCGHHSPESRSHESNQSIENGASERYADAGRVHPPNICSVPSLLDARYSGYLNCHINIAQLCTTVSADETRGEGPAPIPAHRLLPQSVHFITSRQVKGAHKRRQ
uniref:Uncharacterized protein n=1 Tax=Anopheles culicifacies TaxID=139723 RepID=A0A182MWZ1_9DIPT